MSSGLFEPKAVLFAGEDHCGSVVADDLFQLIIRLHELVGNAATEGYHLVLGIGARQLITAATWAVRDLSPSALQITSAAPYYPFFAKLCEFQPHLGVFSADQDSKADLEIVCLPNNPSGYLQAPKSKREKCRYIYDMAYYWPHVCGGSITVPLPRLAEDLSLIHI